MCKLTLVHILNLTPCILYVQYIIAIVQYAKLIIIFIVRYAALITFSFSVNFYSSLKFFKAHHKISSQICCTMALKTRKFIA